VCGVGVGGVGVGVGVGRLLVCLIDIAWSSDGRIVMLEQQHNGSSSVPSIGWNL
jgi:hypothetical protein